MAEAARPSPMTEKTIRRIGSTPSLSNSHTHFNPEKLLPRHVPQFVQNAVRQSIGSGSKTASANSSAHEVLVDQLKDTHLVDDESPPAERQDFDLQPPLPASQVNSTAINKKLFSVQHLQLILLDRTFCARFSAFLQKYKPEYSPILSRYQATQKAKAAVEYANAIAQGLPYLNRESAGADLTPAAIFDDMFQSRSTTAESLLIENALPAYLTHRLVNMVTECLVKEITGRNIPLMQDMVQDIAEVYCLTDPSQPDNPIIYASEEFYHTTQYGMEYVIGRNCRFLNGPDTLPASRKRVSEAIRDGKEVCETILNYRRDGSPFLNLLMIAPLYDNKGRVRYFIGCQIDITNLIDEGRGLDSFQRLLAKEHAERRFGDVVRKGSTLALGDLGYMLNSEEVDLLKSTMSENNSEPPSPSTRMKSNATRRHLGMEHLEEKSLWPLRHLGPSLPGVYQNYLLVRAYPSLRITFTSPSLRIPGLVQSRFMGRIGGPEHVREGILDAFREGVGVTAKVSWLAQSTSQEDASSLAGKPRWIHCTPLLGSDYRIGVWMISKLLLSSAFRGPKLTRP
jgi:PAS domain S-box-containing protein